MALDLEIDEMHISSTSAFAGKTIESSRIRQERGVIVLAITARGHALQSRAG
jgi:K+/H+ antiporter YhaU regulatory subunit KhtT